MPDRDFDPKRGGEGKDHPPPQGDESVAPEQRGNRDKDYGKRDLGSHDRGVERSDWNYEEPDEAKTGKRATEDLDPSDR